MYGIQIECDRINIFTGIQLILNMPWDNAEHFSIGAVWSWVSSDIYICSYINGQLHVTTL